MTREEGILLSAYTGYILAPDWNEIQKFCEKTLGYPVWTHELGDRKVQEELRMKLRPQIVKLVDDISKSEQVHTKSSREQIEEIWKSEMQMLQNNTGVCKKCHRQDGLDSLAHFCRYCGAPLDDKGVDIIMKRLEAIRNRT